MKRTLLMTAAAIALTLPASADASRAINVDVRIQSAHGGDYYRCNTSCGRHTNTVWVEFSPDHGAFVALYAAYSDGSVSLVFPSNDWDAHWVDRSDWYELPVLVPCGVRLQSVQAVAARNWFDPAECWLTSAPRGYGRYGHGRNGHSGHGYGGHGYSGVTFVTTSHQPLFAWEFVVSLGSSHHYRIDRRRSWGAPRVVHSSWWATHKHPKTKYKADHPRVQRAGSRHGKSKNTKVVVTGRDNTSERSVRWTSGTRSGTKVRKAAPGSKSSKARADSGEPKRRSRR